jgi:hypothetical protein
MQRFIHKGLQQLLNRSLTVVEESFTNTFNITIPADCIRVLSTRHVHTSPSGESPAHSATTSSSNQPSPPASQLNPNVTGSSRPSLIRDETFLQEVMNEDVPPWEDEDLLSALMENITTTTNNNNRRAGSTFFTTSGSPSSYSLDDDDVDHTRLPFFSSSWPANTNGTTTGKTTEEHNVPHNITSSSSSDSVSTALDSNTTQSEPYSCKLVADAIFQATTKRIGSKYELREVLLTVRKNRDENKLDIIPRIAIPIAKYILSESRMQSGKFVKFFSKNPWVLTLDPGTDGPGLKKMIDKLDYMAISLKRPPNWGAFCDLIDYMDSVGFKTSEVKTQIFSQNPLGYVQPEALQRDLISNFAFWVAKGANRHQTIQLIIASRSLMETKEAIHFRYEWLAENLGFELQDFVMLPALLSLPFTELAVRFSLAIKNHWIVVKPTEEFPWAPEHLAGQFLKNWQNVPAEYRHLEDPIFKLQEQQRQQEQQQDSDDVDKNTNSSSSSNAYLEKRKMHQKLNLPVPGCRHIRAEDLLHPKQWYEWVGKTSCSRDNLSRHIARWLQNDFVAWLANSGHNFDTYRKSSKSRVGYSSTFSASSLSSSAQGGGYIGGGSSTSTHNGRDQHVRPKSVFPYVFYDPVVVAKQKRDWQAEREAREKAQNDAVVLIRKKNWAFDRAFKLALLKKAGGGGTGGGEEEEEGVEGGGGGGEGT